MITHFAELRLPTVSLSGTKQVYAKRLGLPIVRESFDQISFALTPFTSLSFYLSDSRLAPVHFAIQVPYSSFQESVDIIRQSGLLIASWPDDHEIDETPVRRNLYFRDGDGNLLELIAHSYIPEDVIPAYGPLKALYLREIGFPVQSVSKFRSWLEDEFAFRSKDPDEQFSFVVSGTAHAVVVDYRRPWIPIAMRALQPNMHVVLGTPETTFFSRLLSRYDTTDRADSMEVSLQKDGYNFSIRLTSEFSVDTVHRLNLP
ncbi:MAG: glyoxalase/bleomycin resistance/dioxygenase family protein [Alicyclobacillus macrosporangiidus]|uniref:VOC family protein n=1 Tax=Alicyclobacillus macrosporangiidus TaxID=392015 RepID=UPI0026F2970D|nr:glyoxalase/bleomycin resistance/dioxygenase family protein [Alicyclobacillus macrosporangiidus]MCL6600544.1 glyoxalase/bleomycin resistance/dioxygenase family protein [Alicyclobacillus macrosporangiidus]